MKNTEFVKWNRKIQNGIASSLRLFVFGCYFLTIAHLPPWLVDFLVVSQDVYTEYFRVGAGLLSLGAFVICGMWLLDASFAWLALQVLKRMTK